jgi:hypothetical protein
MVGPLRQDPTLSPKPKGPKALPPILSSDPGPIQEKPKAQKPMSVTGFAENALDDAWELAKGLYEIIPSTVKSYQQNIPKLLKDAKYITPGLVGGALKETAGQIVESVTAPYKEHGASVVYHRPITVASDLITILTLGGGSIKNAGKLAGGTAKGVGKASELVRAGKWLEELPSAMARKGVDAGVKAATGGALDLPKRREFLKLKGEEQGRRILRVEQDVENVVKKIDALTPQEKELFHKARAYGAVDEVGIADEMLPPNVKAALDSYTDLVNKVDPKLVDHGITEFYKSRGFLDEATAQNTLAKKLALEAWDDVSDAAVAKAKGLIDKARKEGKRLPVYGQNVFVDEVGKTLSADTVLDDMITGGKKIREGKINPLEAMKGAKGYTKDPSIYVREMIKNFRNTEAKARLSERLLEHPQLIKGPGAGMSKDAIPEGIHRKYYEDRVRAEALQSITDPTIKRLLRWEYIKNNSSLVRIYDRIHGLFAKSATMFNPKWVTGNVIGDAVLGLLGGSDWVGGVKNLRRGNMPAQIAGRNVTLSTEDLLKNPGALNKAISYLPERAADLAGYVDQATRAGIITKKVARDLKEAGLTFENVAVALEDVLRSTDRFSDVQVGMRLLQERVERSSAEVMRRTKLINRLEEREAALHAKLQEADFRRRVASGEKVERREAKAATAAAKATPPPSGAHDWMFDTSKKPTAKQQATREAKAATTAEAADRARQQAALGAIDQKGFKDGIERLQGIRQKIVNLNAENRAVIRDLTDNLAKRGDLERLVPGLREQVDILRPAVERANAFVGDYLALDGFEQGVLRRAIPFYPWAKAMSMLAFRLPFIAPIKTFAWNRFSDALSSLTNDPDLPEDFKGRVPVAVTKDGKSVWVKLTAYDPFGGLKTSHVAGIPMPQMFNLAERNPFLGLGFQFVGGKTIWDASSIPYGEQMVSIGDGTVLRLKPNGKIEREVPQTPLVSGIMHMFPTTQLIQQVLMPYWTNKYDWAGMPEPVMNSDGSYKYPRELWDRLGAAVGVNVMTRSKEDVVRSRKMKAMKNVREMRAQYKRADPEEREFILDSMKDYIKQEIRGGRE